MQRKFVLMAVLFVCVWNCVGSDKAICHVFYSLYSCQDATVDIFNKDLQLQITETVSCDKRHLFFCSPYSKLIPNQN